MEAILAEIQRALEEKFYYLALSVALSVPDVCSSLEVSREPGERIWKGTEKRYTDWCEKYLIPQFQVFAAIDCWALRGGVIHNGKLHGHPKQQYDRIVFTLPSSITMDENISRDNGGIKESALNLDLGLFCQRMIAAARDWEARRGGDSIVAANMPHIVRLRPNGIYPHFVGMPVIA